MDPFDISLIYHVFPVIILSGILQVRDKTVWKEDRSFLESMEMELPWTGLFNLMLSPSGMFWSVQLYTPRYSQNVIVQLYAVDSINSELIAVSSNFNVNRGK